MNRLMRDGGSLAPRPGRTPPGAKKIEMKPASSSMPSDWYDEKSCKVETHDRKRNVESATATFGQRFSVSKTDERIPAPTTTVSARSLALAQSTVGVNQKRARPGNASVTWET